MAIQAHPRYPNNSASPFCNTAYCATGLIDSHTNLQHWYHHQQQQQHHHFRELYNVSQGAVDPNLHIYNSKAFNCPMFAVELEKKWEEIDQYIKSEDDKLRYMIREHGKQQVIALLKKLESRSVDILKEKDEEIAQATKRRVELEEYLRKLEAENIKWQRVAQEKETMALSLYKTLEEMKESGYLQKNGVMANDAVSCCGGKEEMEEEASGEGEKRIECEFEFEQKRRGGGVMVCKSCHSRSSSFLFLPCRHLSSCKVCNSFLEACPVCTTPKKATIELRL